MGQYNRYITWKEFLPGDYEITSKINPIYKTCDRTRKAEPSIRSAYASRMRAHKNLFELLRANTWKYFVTLTFGDEDRLSEDRCRNLFNKWRKVIKVNFPDMYYVAVPEYHKKGGLHYHIVVGGASAAELGFVDSGRVLHYGKAWLKEDFDNAGFVVNTKTGEGLPIYNIESWKKVGFSTATEIRDPEAVIRYVGKYISKSEIDPRFYNKRRFHASHNINRPKVFKESVPSAPYYDLSDDRTLPEAKLCYESYKRKYRKYDVDLTKEEIIKLRLKGELPIKKHILPFDRE